VAYKEPALRPTNHKVGTVRCWTEEEHLFLPWLDEVVVADFDDAVQLGSMGIGGQVDGAARLRHDDLTVRRRLSADHRRDLDGELRHRQSGVGGGSLGPDDIADKGCGNEAGRPHSRGRWVLLRRRYLVWRSARRRGGGASGALLLGRLLDDGGLAPTHG